MNRRLRSIGTPSYSCQNDIDDAESEVAEGLGVLGFGFLGRQGQISTGELRRPMTAASGATVDRIVEVVERLRQRFAGTTPDPGCAISVRVR